VTTTASTDALEPMDVAGRLDRLRAALATASCDALLVNALIHVRYLTGFTGSAGVLLVRADDALLVTDGRYGGQAADQMARAGVAVGLEVASADQRAVLAAAVDGIGSLGLEADHVSWAQERTYRAEWFPGTDLVATTGLVEELRAVKDVGELARLEAAAGIADDALAALRHRLAERPTEREFALELDTEMRHRGADGPSFDTIVASGPNGARPHARPSNRVITDGDLVVIDFGALVDGYHSDMTRTVIVGEPSVVQQRMLDVVAASQQAGVDAVQAGVVARDVDRACRQVIEEAGWGDAFLHGTGHGVGLEIHEQPRVGSTSDATLRPANVVTVEPGVYLPDHGGVRVEDTVVVTGDGCRRLTHTSKLATV
jgi:Xaa-Pro aminopeptidase